MTKKKKKNKNQLKSLKIMYSNCDLSQTYVWFIIEHYKKNEYWSMTLDLLRLIGPDFTNDELRLNKKMLFKMIDKECEC